MLKQYHEEGQSSPMLLELGSSGLLLLHGVCQSDQFKNDWDLDKALKNCYSIFKKSQENVQIT